MRNKNIKPVELRPTPIQQPPKDAEVPAQSKPITRLPKKKG
jgi:hypothetical protein